MNPKELAGRRSADYVQNGMCVGLGTGSTAYWMIQELGDRVRQGLEIKAIATSVESENLARELGIPQVGFAEIDHLDVTIDGADEADVQLNLIKGGGGALLREKIVAFASRYYVIVCDESKYVERLGAFGVPIEIFRFGWEETFRQIEKIGGKPVLRQRDGQTFITDNGNYILDTQFGQIADPDTLENRLHKLPGVAECGLFLNRTDTLIIATKSGEVIIKHRLPK